MPNCYLCNKPLSGKIDRDHVIPINAFGPHHSSNIRDTHATCNRRKHSKLVAPEIGQTYPLPLRTSYRRNDAISLYRRACWHRDRFRDLRKLRDWNWLSWPTIRRLEVFIEPRGLWISHSMWKAGMGERTKLTEYLVSRGVPEVIVRQWLWCAENNLGQALDTQWPTE